MRKVKSLTNSSSGRLMCYLVGFAVTVFLIIWFLMK
jgi:blocked-early-in-transport protein 1